MNARAPGTDGSGGPVLAIATLGSAALLFIFPPPTTTRAAHDLEAPVIGMDDRGGVSLDAGGTVVRYTTDGSIPDFTSRLWNGTLEAERSVGDRLMTTPTSVQWRHPIGDLPHACTVRARAFAGGRAGPVATRTIGIPRIHGQLPVIALSVGPAAFFDPDTGIYVVGHAIFHPERPEVRSYPRSNKWWRYPGNFHGRGEEWERAAHWEYFAADGELLESGPIDVRIHGNNTRGFAQHALRLLFPKPGVGHPLFGEMRGSGHRSLVLRASGNDQDRTFFRDGLQHRLCAGLPFEVSADLPAVVYLNGAYWGLHNVRERIDAKEIARRHGLKPKEIGILADRLVLQEGDADEVARFSRFLTMTERWDASGQAFVDSLERHLDVEGFLTYMAAQVILGNMDWPDQNVKWWRCTRPSADAGPADGRWRFIMGDSDIGFGMATDAHIDMFRRLDHSAAPTARLYRACLRSPALEARWDRILEVLLWQHFTAERMRAAAEVMQRAIQAEMPRHIQRWRRPLTMADWKAHVEDLMIFATERTAAVSAQWRQRKELLP